MQKLDYRKRREALLELVKAEHAACAGTIFLFAPCDDPGRSFVQDSSFYYFSGVVEPASVMMVRSSEHVFYRPAYTDLRNQWVASPIQITENYMQTIGFDSLASTGERYDSIHVYPYFDFNLYHNIIGLLSNMLARGEKIFTIYPTNSYESFMVRMVIDRLALVVPHLKENIIDISLQVAQLRRKKDMSEIESLYKAVDISVQAHYTSISMLKAGNKESDMQAALEYVFTEHGAVPAYPSIVAGGLRGTVLHYHQNNHAFVAGDLVVVDAGARYNYYCADLTRAYPVSGTFSSEQKELYEMVLEAQETVADQAKPGMYLMNKDIQDASLHHIAVNVFKKYGYEQYFTHGVGHFLGLDVHDVGSRTDVLQEGDVITIEPGLYIPEKNIGIRIEDNYWIVDQTTPVCLSEALPKTVKAVEDMIQQSFDVDLE
ncbi:aminopeptidase P N-terminal domain-containing protein [Candidatus Babeliales bacterium]|nr:aminopeptidase P N-terminal domain-containing protein [Candidatus Babeliales bacterium]MBP9843609.1 aminopeptidase P N-terminal domain-containing protein [Candidatus Babeliales bacterium]